SARVQAKNWRLMAFGCLFLSAGFAAALVWQSTQGSVTPWVVEVDRLGGAKAVAPASSTYKATDPQIAFHLARFIEHVRGLPMDATFTANENGQGVSGSHDLRICPRGMHNIQAPADQL